MLWSRIFGISRISTVSKRQNLQTGFSLIEVLVALSLFAFISCCASHLLMRSKMLERLAIEQEQQVYSLMEKTEQQYLDVQPR